MHYEVLIIMDHLKQNILMNLADYTQTIEFALEGDNLDFDERLFYLGHLAMCARLFKSIYLNEHHDLGTMIKLESNSYKLGTPRNERGDIAKEAWALFADYLNVYISVL
jgi:hypothetical protein